MKKYRITAIITLGYLLIPSISVAQSSYDLNKICRRSNDYQDCLYRNTLKNKYNYDSYRINRESSSPIQIPVIPYTKK